MVAKAHASRLSPSIQRATVFTFPVNSSSRGYHVYQSIWPNPSRDDELADMQTAGKPAGNSIPRSAYTEQWDKFLGMIS